MKREPPSPTIRFDPAPGEWSALVRWSADEKSKHARAALGLPTDRPVIMTGHQAEFWHPGILAKYIGASTLASAHAAHPAHVVVDSDQTDPGAIRIPRADDSGRLIAETVRVLPPPPAGVPSASLAPALPDRTNAAPALASVSDGLAAIHAALGRHADAPTLGEQVGRSITGLMQPWAPMPAPIYTSRLSSVEAFQSLVQRMMDDAPACIAAHNEAVGLTPEARVAPLALRPRAELPLWRLRPGRPRGRVYADELASIPAAELAPRALLLTALLRLHACDLFIHGAGGAIYDRITDHWIDRWLGARLAPTTMATATALLPLRVEAPTVEAIERAAWTAHHARHDFALLGDLAASDRKRSLVGAIRAARERSGNPLPLYRELQALLADGRARHADALDDLAKRAAAMRSRLSEARVAADRTWAFPLYSPSSLDTLAASIRGAFR